MRIYADESGNFDVRTPASRSVLCSVIVPDTFYQTVRDFIQAFDGRVHSTQGILGEVKGSDLTTENREQLCQFIGLNHRELTVVTTVVDSDVITPQLLAAFREGQAERFRENKEVYTRSGGASPDILKHYDRIAKTAEFPSRLSDAEFLQAFAFTSSVPDILQLSVVRYLEDRYRSSFERFDWVLDRKLKSKLSAMEKFLSRNLMPFLDAASKSGRGGLKVPETWGRDNHPFARFSVPEGILLNAVFENGLQFRDSKDEPGLRLADMVANTVCGYLRSPSDALYKKCYTLLSPAMITASGHRRTTITLRSTPKGSGLSVPQ